IALARELAAELDALVEAAARAMHEQDGGPFAHFGVFDRAACGGGDAAAVRHALGRTLQIRRKPRVGQAEADARRRHHAGERAKEVPPGDLEPSFHRTMNTECSVTATFSTPSARTSNSIGCVPLGAGAARTLMGTMRLVAAGTPTVGSPQTWMSGRPRTPTVKARASSVVFMICRR